MVVVDRGLCVTSGVSSLKLVCSCKEHILNTTCDANCDMNSIEFLLFKMFVIFRFVQRNDVTVFC